jgi:hypothetical protein
MYIWSKNNKIKQYSNFIMHYSFKPSTGPMGIVNKLVEVKRDIVLALNRYRTSYESLKTV